MNKKIIGISVFLIMIGIIGIILPFNQIPVPDRGFLISNPEQDKKEMVINNTNKKLILFYPIPSKIKTWKSGQKKKISDIVGKRYAYRYYSGQNYDFYKVEIFSKEDSILIPEYKRVKVKIKGNCYKVIPGDNLVDYFQVHIEGMPFSDNAINTKFFNFKAGEIIGKEKFKGAPKMSEKFGY